MTRDERSQWFLNRWARPADENAAAVQRMQRQSAETAFFPWHSLGPDNIAGRATCLTADPRNADVIYLGTAGGGLWRSDDAGVNWKPMSDGLPSLSIGAVALDPADPDKVYLATGEANLSLDSYPGHGVFCAKAGSDWKEANDTKDGRSPVPNRIGAIAVDPFRPGRVLIGAASIVDEDLGGLYIGQADAKGVFVWDFVDGFAFGDEATARPLNPSGPYRCHSVIFHPTKPNVVFAAVHLRGWRSGIYRSDDGGANWTHLETGLPSGEKFGRTSLAIRSFAATQGPAQASGIAEQTVLWAYAAHAREGVLGVFRSDDDGETWLSLGGTHFANERSPEYDNCIAIAPDDPNFVVCGGQDLHWTQNNGELWQQLTESDAPETDRFFAPAGHHALAIVIKGEFERRIYSANDGGFSVAMRIGDWRWASRNAGLATSMCYKVDVAGPEGDTVVGGLHQRGTVLHRKADPANAYVRELINEGGWVLIDPEDPEHRIATTSPGHVYRRTRTSDWTDITPDDLEDDEKEAIWLPVVAMDSNDRAAPHPLLLGTKRIWRSGDDGVTWRAVTVELDGSPVSAIHICSDASRTVYAGTERGAFFRSDDGGNTWSENLAGIDLPASYITRIAGNTREVLVTLGPTPPQDPPMPHVYLSFDGGRQWRSADPEGSLPDAPHNGVIVAGRGAFVATDFGVYWGDKQIPQDLDTNQGLGEMNYRWTDISGDLPQAFVMDLVYHDASRTLTAATFGRGIFRHTIGSETDPSAEYRAWAATQQETNSPAAEPRPPATTAAEATTPPAPPPAP